MDTEKQRQCRRDDARLTECGNAGYLWCLQSHQPTANACQESFWVDQNIEGPAGLRYEISDLSSCENRAFLLMKATVYCRFYYWSKVEIVQTKIIMQSILHWRDQAIAIEMEWAWLRKFNAWISWVLLWSCDNVLKFDWYCQLSGSGSNSLNSQKLPGRFSYGLGKEATEGSALRGLTLGTLASKYNHITVRCVPPAWLRTSAPCLWYFAQLKFVNS